MNWGGYPFCGHSVIMGKMKKPWRDMEGVLGMFGENVRAARRAYRLFVEKGIGEGRRRDLTGGGLLRSAGGWEGVKEEFRGKLKYLDESGDEVWQDHSEVVATVLENEPGKLN